MKQFLSILFATAFGVASMFSQTIVGTDPENKNVILEGFTGLNCGFCPQGHTIAQGIYDAHPDDVVLIAIHTGGYANPSGSQPDYRTQWGSAIANQSGLIGYPAGTVNRHLFPGHSQGSGTAQSRGSWVTTSNIVLAESSYLNVGVEATIVTSTRQLAVYVEVYYTDDCPVGTNYLNVAILQSNILGPQSGGNAGNNYNHKHMLRHLLTGQWGVEITETTQGSLYTGTFLYELPDDYKDVDVVLEDLDIAAFVTETHQEAISGNLADITTVDSYEYDAAISTVNILQSACSGKLEPVVSLKNYGSENLTSLDYVYSVNGGAPETYTWTGNLAQNETTLVTLPLIMYNATDNNTVEVSCDSPNGETDQLPQNNTFAGNIPGSQTYPQECKFGVQFYGDPQDITWNITNMDGNVLVEGGPYDNTQLKLTDFTFPETGCYTLTLNDASGEGLTEGYYFIADANTDVLWMGNKFTYTTSAELAYGMVVDIQETIIAEHISIYPNPVTQTANIEFTLNSESDLEVAVLDLLGKNMMTIYKGSMNSGQHKLQFDASNLAQGIYFVKLQSNNEIITKKIMISK